MLNILFFLAFLPAPPGLVSGHGVDLALQRHPAARPSRALSAGPRLPPVLPGTPGVHAQLPHTRDPAYPPGEPGGPGQGSQSKPQGEWQTATPRRGRAEGQKNICIVNECQKVQDTIFFYQSQNYRK